MSFLPLLLGTGIGAGLALVVWGLRTRPPPEDPPRPTRRIGPRFADLPARLARAGVAGLIIGLLTRWPVGVIGGAALGFFASDLLAGRGQRSAEVDRSAAIASWTEMLRDTMAAAAGLEQAIVTTAPLAPAPIRPQIRALIVRLERQRLAPALSQLADDLADPTADLVVSALTLAASGEAQDLSDLLGSLAGAARDTSTRWASSGADATMAAGRFSRSRAAARSGRAGVRLLARTSTPVPRTAPVRSIRTTTTPRLAVR